MSFVKNKLRVAIIGTGNIGTDLLIKVLRSKLLDCTLFVGRNKDSNGLLKAKSLGVKTSVNGISGLIDNYMSYDLVFDATSADQHKKHWPILKDLKKILVDLTPSNVGKQIVPAVNIEECLDYQNINMVSCGGQSSIPIAYLISKIFPCVKYIEVVNSIASKSAGPATRINIDEYIETTEIGLKSFTGCKSAKSILILNPSNPPINMQSTISAKVEGADIEKLNRAIPSLVRVVKSYVPGYELLVNPVWESNRIVVIVRVIGKGDYLPKYAGNMDIINCAAIAVAEKISHVM